MANDDDDDKPIDEDEIPLVLTRTFLEVMALQERGRAEIYVVEGNEDTESISIDIPKTRGAVVIVLTDVAYDDKKESAGFIEI